MATQAKITSTEALETFRAALIVFMAKTKVALGDASDAVKRTRQWIQHDQRTHLEGEYRRARKQMEQAQAELLSLNGAHQSSARMSRQMAIAKAKRDIAELEVKMRKLKAWSQAYDSATDPILKRVDRLGQTVNELPKAVAYLVAVQKALADYSDSAGPPPNLPTSGSSTEVATEPGAEAAVEPVPEATPEASPEVAPVSSPEGQT